MYLQMYFTNNVLYNKIHFYPQSSASGIFLYKKTFQSISERPDLHFIGDICELLHILVVCLLAAA
jgi:hypothetical protein